MFTSMAEKLRLRMIEKLVRLVVFAQDRFSNHLDMLLSLLLVSICKNNTLVYKSLSGYRNQLLINWCFAISFTNKFIYTVYIYMFLFSINGEYGEFVIVRKCGLSLEDQ